jgi:hypothetical protein
MLLDIMGLLLLENGITCVQLENTWIADIKIQLCTK